MVVCGRVVVSSAVVVVVAAYKYLDAVQLGCLSRSASAILQVQIPDVLGDHGSCKMLGHKIGRVLLAWDLMQWHELLGALLL